MGKRDTALVVGAGDSLGAALSRRFAREGLKVVAVRRNPDKLQPLVDEVRAAGGQIEGLACDARKEDQVVDLFARIERDLGPLAVVVANVGGNIRFPLLEMTAQKFFKVWEMACFSAFLTAREAMRVMAPRGRGTMFFTGATAGLRGGEGFSGFATGKFGLRALAQSTAREFGKQGIHVAHVVIDGPIDTPWVRERFPDMVKARPADGLLNPDDIADTYWAIHSQKRSAWTFEADLRPWLEPMTTF
jgi:NAD(P)-dependent dehydrogenase (short-subunit alcohol dehydrogenase family)